MPFQLQQRCSQGARGVEGGGVPDLDEMVDGRFGASGLGKWGREIDLESSLPLDLLGCIWWGTSCQAGIGWCRPESLGQPDWILFLLMDVVSVSVSNALVLY